MSDGIRADAIDWGNIGKNAVSIARHVFVEKCSECGRTR